MVAAGCPAVFPMTVPLVFSGFMPDHGEVIGGWNEKPPDFHAYGL
jgi:hypothetical protein